MTSMTACNLVTDCAIPKQVNSARSATVCFNSFLKVKEDGGNLIALDVCKP